MVSSIRMPMLVQGRFERTETIIVHFKHGKRLERTESNLIHLNGAAFQQSFRKNIQVIRTKNGHIVQHEIS